MNGEGYIQFFDNAVPDDLCDRIVEAHLEKEHNGQTQVSRGYEGAQGRIDLRYRANVLSHFRDGEPLLEELRSYIAQYRDIYAKKVNYPVAQGIGLKEHRISVKRYPVPFGMFEEHADIMPSAATREITIVVYLNTVEEGGETHFVYQDLLVKAVKGRIAVFPPFWMYYHKSLPPISNDKIAASAFHEISR